MKKLLVLLFSILILPFSVYASDVYYCSDDAITAFDPAVNYKYENFTGQKFKIMIDFENKNVVSEKLYYGGVFDQKCWYRNDNDILYCMNEVGISFSINKLNSKFIRSKIYQSRDMSDGDHIFLGHGSCEKF
ncbi:hypothetical protein N9R34_01365 [Candidatus Thioglobus sp.]|nr:hypothetical protein [Candidatus Thioglobus sp.]MDB4099181.1 hypothetical protein [Candidatus Thioglobus sp.]